MEELASVPAKEPRKKRSFFALKVVAAVLVVLLFLASIAYAILSGGELLEKPVVDNSTKGLIRLDNPNYQKTYFEGDAFSFDKDKNQVTLVAKDPALENIVKIDDLPGPEYGFVVRQVFDAQGKLVDPESIEDNAVLKPKEEETEKKLARRVLLAETEETTSEEDETTEEGEGEEEIPVYTYVDSDFYEEAKDIKIAKDMGTIYLTSKRYQDLRLPLETEMIEGRIDESTLVQSMLLEAEDADVYKDDVLLTEAQMASLPDTNKPFDSSKGSTIAGEGCSGGACLRSFGTNNMKIDFVVVSSKNMDVQLTIKVCERPKAGEFDTFYRFTLNGVTYDAVDDQTVPADANGGYYVPYSMEPVTVSLQRGINHFTFESGNNVNTSSPVNFDAIQIAAEESILGTMESIIQ